MRYIDKYDPSDFAGGCVYDQDAEEPENFEGIHIGDDVLVTAKGFKAIGIVLDLTDNEAKIMTASGAHHWLAYEDYSFTVV